MAVREDGHFLYGFATEDERAAFRQLLKVAGIGARTALAVLSGLSVPTSPRPSRCRRAAGW
jgi:Holliday junction DNA helicase RuvA